MEAETIALETEVAKKELDRLNVDLSVAEEAVNNAQVELDRITSEVA